MSVTGLYSLLNAGRIVAGVNSIDKIGELVKGLGASRVLLLTDKGVLNAGLIQKPVNIMRNAGIMVEVIGDVPPEPEIGQVKKIYEAAAVFSCNMVIGIGGGSAMDTAKLISVMLTNEVSLEEMLGVDKIIEKGLPLLMVPTTAGTGSEATPNAIVTIPEQELKIGVVSSKLMPDCVILDPMMTLKLPPALTASTGIDALTHALECYISNKANPLSDTFALRAVGLIYGSIRKAYGDGDDINARHDMLLGSFFGGMCIASSGTAAVHALAYPLGGKYKTPHGLSNAILLPVVTEFNADVCADRLKDIGDAMSLTMEGLLPEQAAQKVVEALYGLVLDLGIPTSLKGFGIDERDLEGLTEAASKVTRLLDNNPKKLSSDDIRSIYQRLL
jgi:alcohol dehydrogenase